MKARQRTSLVNNKALPLLTKIEAVKGYINRLPQTGGFSVNLNTAEPEKGYMVGGYSDVYENPTDMEIEALLKSATENFYVGGWVDNKKTYIELSRRFDNRKTALMAGKESGEIAIWDVKNKNNIRIK